MKKQLITAALLASLAGTANASVIEFKGSLFGGTDFQFDVMDLKVESGADAANVTQTDTNNDGTIIGPDSFTEMGGTSVVGFTNNGAAIPFANPALHGFGGVIDVNYAIFFDYKVEGTATQDITGDLQVNFNNLVSADLYVLWDADNSASAVDADPSWETRVDLASFSLLNGGCDIDATVNGAGFVEVEDASSCRIDMASQFIAGYFTALASGKDLSEYNATVPVTTTLEATVQSIDGLAFVYPGGAGSSQDFTVAHDSNLTFAVPEPSSIAILGLGLLGLARIRRQS